MTSLQPLLVDEDLQCLTARERAYHTLRYRLITLDLAPGTVIDMVQLMNETVIGKTPLMDAVQRLALEDLLAIHPRRGTIVTEPSFSQAHHIFEVRDVFEGRAARMAAQYAHEPERIELRQLLNRQMADRARMDYRQFLLNDFHMHMRVAKASGNPMLLRAMSHLLALNVRLWFVFLKQKGPHSRYLFSHEPIVQAIENADPVAAEAAVVQHVRESNQTLLTMFTPLTASLLSNGNRSQSV